MGGYNKIIWFYQLSGKHKLASVKSFKADVWSFSPFVSHIIFFVCCLVSQGASKSINQDGVHSYGFSIPLSELAKISEESQVWPGVYQVSIITYLIERFCRTLESHSLSLFLRYPLTLGNCSESHMEFVLCRLW